MRRLFSAILLTAAVFGFCLNASAMPAAMGDGGIFDPEFYASANPDAAAVCGTDAGLLYAHYVNSGRREGRLPYQPAGNADLRQMPDGGWFDADFYAAAYMDIASKLGYSESLLYDHFLETGRREGRLPYAGASTGHILTPPAVVKPRLIASQGGYTLYLRNALPFGFVQDRQTGIYACMVTDVSVQFAGGRPWFLFTNQMAYQSHIHSFYYRANIYDASGKLVDVCYVSLEHDALQALVPLEQGPGTYSVEIFEW